MGRIAIRVFFPAWSLWLEYMIPQSMRFAQIRDLVFESLAVAYGEMFVGSNAEDWFFYDKERSVICNPEQTAEEAGLYSGYQLYCY